ncbi:hypothetical protein [Labrenzia sp. VG12]|uniref:hypothetical protein n=1 Tax=Labrenzia sp. VG12 TaxID=2021862 RepID=UPI001AD8CACC|nr:hypothetical protein [Labrenzia sp. VG12]
MFGRASLFATTYFLACSLLVSLATVMPSGSGPLAVFASPWGASALEVIARAEGRIVHVGNTRWVAVTDQTDPELVARLYRSGAGFVASTVVAKACASWIGTPMERDL